MKVYSIMDLTGLQPAYIEAAPRVEISDALTSENAAEIALWCGGHVDGDHVVFSWSGVRGAITFGDRVVKKFHNGGNLPTDMFGVSESTYKRVVSRFL